MDKSIVIICDGSFPKSEYPRYIIRAADLIVCCDGALTKFIRNSRSIFGEERLPDLVIGDMDTLSPAMQRKYSDIIIREEQQEHNDQTKAVRWVLNNIDNIGLFFSARYHRFPDFIKRAFDLGISCTINIKVSDPAKGMVYLNGRNIAAPNKSNNKYFSDYPVTATAVPAEGAVFVGWQVSSAKAALSDPAATTTEITFSRSFTLTAVFE